MDTLAIFSRMLFLVSIILAGYAAKRLRLVPEGTTRVLALVILNVTLPCAVVKAMNGVWLQPSQYWVLCAGIVLNLLFTGVGWAIARRHPESTVRTFSALNATGFNIGMFAMAFIQSFFGPQVFLTVCLCDVGNAIMTLGGNYACAAWIGGLPGMDARSIARACLSPVFLIYLLFLLLSPLQASLPVPVSDAAGLVAQANPYLCMFMLGLGLRFRMGGESLRLVTRILAWRYLVAAALCALFLLLPIAATTKAALCVFTIAPVSGLNPIYTLKFSKRLFEYSSTSSCASIVASTLVFLLAIPALVAFAGE